MTMENDISSSERLAGILVAALSAHWAEVLSEVWKVVWKLWRGWAEEGMYEVLEYESILELQDVSGENAYYRKRQKVRYLQNNILAYQDQAWGDGEILLNYRCSPGVPVDQYRPGQTTFILISLREVKDRGDIDEFNIEWGIHNGFLRASELWSVEVNHRTCRLKLQVVFPKERPPRRCSLVRRVNQKTESLGEEHRSELPDGRWVVSWETNQPRLYESYGLQWEW